MTFLQLGSTAYSPILSSQSTNGFSQRCLTESLPLDTLSELSSKQKVSVGVGKKEHGAVWSHFYHSFIMGFQSSLILPGLHFLFCEPSWRTRLSPSSPVYFFSLQENSGVSCYF